MLKMKFLFLLPLIFGPTYSQRTGTVKEESHLPLKTFLCTGPGNCQEEQNSLVVEASWRWVHTDSGNPCFVGSAWDTNLCPDPDTCTQNCVIEGYDANDWSNVGVTTSGSMASLRYVTITSSGSKSVGSRMYLLDSSGEKYRLFYLLNKEMSFDVDLSELECGMNGSFYFSEMEEDGGKSRYPTNEAGAKYGTGYCDAQCAHFVKWINGKANSKDWNVYQGYYGSCCSELDLLEANSYAHQLTSHPCATNGQTQCEGAACGDGEFFHEGLCDKEGCEFNPWKNGNQTFFGRGPQFTIDTTKPLTLVTQFVSSDGTDQGDLVEIRRYYVQEGRVIDNSNVNFAGIDRYNSISDNYCSDTKNLFGSTYNDHQDLGGLRQMGESMKRGMVLVMSLWDDGGSHMLWLDSNFPVDANPSSPGVSRGPCATSSGNPSDLQNNYPDATVRFSNIKFGPIGSTYSF